MIAAFEKVQVTALRRQHRHKVHAGTVQHVRDLVGSSGAWMVEEAASVCSVTKTRDVQLLSLPNRELL